MGQFHVPAKLTGPTGISETVSLLVDTGATFLTIPRSLAEGLELRPTRTQAIITAGGREEVWPLASVQIELEGREVPTPCLIAPDGPPLLGAVALRASSLRSIRSPNDCFRPRHTCWSSGRRREPFSSDHRIVPA
ncbi:MAG TPA: retropepsin-like aspartic protease [Methylomirabilota bacterium]|jgi:predicted aspartyl protease|nr:retropepsin-like aspartic protease [Methylomirabilota bacterium]